MDDFYAYYVIDEENVTIGQIKAISPHEVKVFGDMPFIRIPSDYGLQFTTGGVSISNWVVQYDDESDDMILAKITEGTGVTHVSVLTHVPRTQKNPELVITFKRKASLFHARVSSMGLRKPKHKLHFFVTPVDDPNMCYFQFPVDFSTAMEEDGCVIECPIELPGKFSIYTNRVLDRYQMKITR